MTHPELDSNGSYVGNLCGTHFNADLPQFAMNLLLDTPSAHLRNASFIGCQGVFGLLATTAVADMPVGMPTPSDSARSSASDEHKSGAIAWLDLDGLPSLRAPRTSSSTHRKEWLRSRHSDLSPTIICLAR